MRKLKDFIYKIIYLRQWKYQYLSSSKTYNFLFENISIFEKIKKWFLVSEYLQKGFLENNISLISYSKEIEEKIISKFNLGKNEINHLRIYSTLSLHDYNFIKKFISDDHKIVEIGGGFGVMLPNFINHKNYFLYEPIKPVARIVDCFNKEILNNNIKILKTKESIKELNNVDLYYAIDCFGEISKNNFKNYLNIFENNLKIGGKILIRDWWWNKKNYNLLLDKKDSFNLSKIKINYIKDGGSNIWYILSKK